MCNGMILPLSWSPTAIYRWHLFVRSRARSWNGRYDVARLLDRLLGSNKRVLHDRQPQSTVARCSDPRAQPSPATPGPRGWLGGASLLITFGILEVFNSGPRVDRVGYVGQGVNKEHPRSPVITRFIFFSKRNHGRANSTPSNPQLQRRWPDGQSLPWPKAHPRRRDISLRQTR